MSDAQATQARGGDELREALERKATWFRFDPGTGEYANEYCTVKPADAAGFVAMVPVAAALASTDMAGASVPDRLARRMGAEFVARDAASPKATATASVREPWPGYAADMERRRVVTLAKVGQMLSIMAGGEVPEVEGYDAADLYAEVLMSLGVEDAEFPDLALQGVEDDPEAYFLTDSGTAATIGGERFANDAAAKALYDTWADQSGWVPWVERGNSDMQERARREVML